MNLKVALIQTDIKPDKEENIKKILIPTLCIKHGKRGDVIPVFQEHQILLL